MNDFTKDELEALADELEGTNYPKLREKIQSMIDNYDKQFCSNCSFIRDGQLLDTFWNAGHYLEGGAFCGVWK